MKFYYFAKFEVNEPGLSPDLAPESAAERFAHATLARLPVARNSVAHAGHEVPP